MKRRRSGFTLLEVLVVIGVILVLISLAVISYQVVERSAAANQTKVTLNNLNAMLSELDATAGSGALPTYSYVDSMMKTQNQNVIGASPGALTPTPDSQVWTIGDVTGTSPDRTGPIVTKTAGAMASLMRVPNNQKAIGQLPSSKVMAIAGSQVLLDGWGNPIIYVPRGGISVYVTTGNNVATQIIVKGRDNRPFFASAGPDGDFGANSLGSPVPATATAMGDDNVYSKE